MSKFSMPTILVVLMTLGVSADSKPINLKGNDLPNSLKNSMEFKTVIAKVIVTADPEANEEEADVEATALAEVFPNSYVRTMNLGGGNYQAIISGIPKKTKNLEFTARICDSQNDRIVEQTLLVDISRNNEVEIPINISTH